MLSCVIFRRSEAAPQPRSAQGRVPGAYAGKTVLQCRMNVLSSLENRDAIRKR